MTEVLDRWRPYMIERFSADGLNAVRLLRDFVVDAVGPAALEAVALELAGLPEADLYRGMAEFSCELAKTLIVCGLPESCRVGVEIAAGDLISERVRAMQLQGAGHA